MTPEDLTNCNPYKNIHYSEHGTVDKTEPKKDENGYVFGDMTAVALQAFTNAKGGKSRKNGKRKLKRKTKRLHRK